MVNIKNKLSTNTINYFSISASPECADASHNLLPRRRLRIWALLCRARCGLHAIAGKNPLPRLDQLGGAVYFATALWVAGRIRRLRPGYDGRQY
jgi:hypothetical protein